MEDQEKQLPTGDQAVSQKIRRARISGLENISMVTLIKNKVCLHGSSCLRSVAEQTGHICL